MRCCHRRIPRHVGWACGLPISVFSRAIWSQGRGRSLVDELEEPTSRCLVVDLGSLDTIHEQRLISETVLSTLWRNRSRRQPCLIVIDEAHNVCPRQPGDTVTALASNYAALIAAEGRKFGLYLCCLDAAATEGE